MCTAIGLAPWQIHYNPNMRRRRLGEFAPASTDRPIELIGKLYLPLHRRERSRRILAIRLSGAPESGS